MKHEKDIFETFRNVEVNIPLFNLIKAVPRYAKFLKQLCTTKRQQAQNSKKKVKIKEQISAAFQKSLPEKCEDPGIFSIPIIIGNSLFDRAMLDLGASINVIPSYLYENLKIGPLHDTCVTIKLADRSNVRPLGKIEDVLVRVGDLTFPTDFYVLKMDYDKNAIPILLGRPFMKTANAIVNVSTGSMTMEHEGNTLTYNIYTPTKSPANVHSMCEIDEIDPVLHGEIDCGNAAIMCLAHKTKHDWPPDPDLGIRPMILTLQGEPSSPSVVQVARKRKKQPPKKNKCGGVAEKSKTKAKKPRQKRQQGRPHQAPIKRVWRVKIPKDPGDRIQLSTIVSSHDVKQGACREATRPRYVFFH